MSWNRITAIHRTRHNISTPQCISQGCQVHLMRPPHHAALLARPRLPSPEPPTLRAPSTRPYPRAQVAPVKAGEIIPTQHASHHCAAFLYLRRQSLLHGLQAVAHGVEAEPFRVLGFRPDPKRGSHDRAALLLLRRQGLLHRLQPVAHGVEVGPRVEVGRPAVLHHRLQLGRHLLAKPAPGPSFTMLAET